MNNPSQAPAALRSLIIFAICIPLAIGVGYLLANPLDYQSVGYIGLLMAVLAFPVLMKWHYPLLLFSWTAPIMVFFLPGSPNLFVVMVVISLSISVLERIMNNRQQFLSAPQVALPLVAMVLIICITAKLTGGFGLRSMGSDVYGGKKYVLFMIGILSFFALIARPIPKAKAKLYVTLFTIGAGLCFIQDLFNYLPEPLRFIYLVIPPNTVLTMAESTGAEVALGSTGFGGIQATGVMLASLMILRYGLRGIFLDGKHWRPFAFALCIALIMLGGQRSALLHVILLSGIIFWLEKLHRTRLMLIFLTMAILGATLLVPLATHLPRTFQRSLSFLPIEIDHQARASAEDSSEWRLNMWTALLPEVPKHWLLGAGLAIKTETFNEMMGGNQSFKVIDAANNPLALAHDFHSGPLSMILSFGIWCVLAFVWLCIGGLYILYRNFKYGDPDLLIYNRYLLAFFVMAVFMFLFIVGDLTNDLARFSGILGMSLALNNGIRGPARQSNPATAPVPSGPILINRRPRPAMLPR